MRSKVRLEKYINFSLISNCIVFNTLAGCCKNKNKNEKKKGCCNNKQNLENDISNNNNNNNNEDLNKKPDDLNPKKKPDDDGGSEETEEENAKKLLEKQKQDNLKKQLNDYKTKIQSILDMISPLLDNLEKKYNTDILKDGEELSKVNVSDYNTAEIKTKLDEVTSMFKDDDLYKDANTGFKTKLDSLNTRYNTLDKNIKALGVKVNEVKVKLAENKDKDDLISNIDDLLKEIEGLLNNDKDNSLIEIKNTDTDLTEKKIKINEYIGKFNDIKINLEVLEEKVSKLTGEEKTNYDTKVKDLKDEIIKSENSILDLFKKKFDEFKSNNPTKVIEEFINTNFTEANLKSDKIKDTSANIDKFKKEHDFSNLGEFKTEIGDISKEAGKNKLYNKNISDTIIYTDIEGIFDDLTNKNKQIDKIKSFCNIISDIYGKKEDESFKTYLNNYLKTLDDEIRDDTDGKIIDILKEVIKSIINNNFISKLDFDKLNNLNFSECTDNNSILDYFNAIEEAKSTLSKVDIASSEDYNKLKHLKYDLYNTKIQELKNKLKEKSEDKNYEAKKFEFNYFLNNYDNTYEECNKEITYPDFNKNDNLNFDKLKEKLDNIKIEDIEKSFDVIKKLEEDFNNYSRLLNDTKKAIVKKIESCENLLGMLKEDKNSIYFKYKKIDTNDKITEINAKKSELEAKIKSSYDTKINEYDEFSKNNDKFKKFDNYYNRELNFTIKLTTNSFDNKNEKICQLTLETKDFDGNDIKYASTDTGPEELKPETYDYEDTLNSKIKNCSKFRISDNLYNEIKRKSCTNKLRVDSNIKKLLPPKEVKFFCNYYLIMEIKDDDHYIYFLPITNSYYNSLCNKSDFINVFGSNIILSSYILSLFGIYRNKKFKEPAVVKIHSLDTETLTMLGENINFFDLRGLHFEKIHRNFEFPKNSTIVFGFNSIGDKVNFDENTINYIYKEDEKVTVYIVKREKTDNIKVDMYQELLKKFPKNDNKIKVEFINDDDVPNIKI